MERGPRARNHPRMDISHDAIPHLAALARAALRMLEEMDQGRIYDLWERAAATTRRTVPAKDAATAIASHREQQGVLVSRRWMGAYRDPDQSHFLRLTFQSQFAAWSGEEMITLQHEPDGVWRLSGYGTRPAKAPPATESVAHRESS